MISASAKIIGLFIPFKNDYFAGELTNQFFILWQKT